MLDTSALTNTYIYEKGTQIMQIYRTYAKEVIYDFRQIEDSFVNKPRGGLWGCRGDEWWNWANLEEFPCATTYFEWQLKEGAKVYTIKNENDFIYLLKNFPREVRHACLEPTVDSIDFIKLWKSGYDAVELTEEANNAMHTGFQATAKNFTTAQLISDKKYVTAMLMGINSWDVPSICVFDPRETVCITSRLKSQFTHKEVEKLSEAVMSGGIPYVSD